MFKFYNEFCVINCNYYGLNRFLNLHQNKEFPCESTQFIKVSKLMCGEKGMYKELHFLLIVTNKNTNPEAFFTCQFYLTRKSENIFYSFPPSSIW